MASTYLSPTIITREALRILHQKSVFIGSINRQYDDRFANSGASPSGKIGPTLQIRLPNQATVRTGTTMQTQDIAEEKVDLTVSTVKGVDFTFNNTDLALTIDEFSARYLQPFMSRLAAEIEADALSMYKDVYNFVDGDAAALDVVHFVNGGQKLDESLAPGDPRTALLCPTHNSKFIVATKGIFNPQAQLGDQFKSGMVAKDTLGFDVKKTTLLTSHQTGTAVATSLYTVNGATQNGAAITVQTGTTTFLKGDLVTFAGSNAVHPETKADLGYLKQFVITADSGASATSLAISPSLTISGPKQNVTGYPTNTGAVVKLGVAAVASATLVQSLLYHPDAFTFVTADLPDVSKFGAWGSVQRMDNISMSISRQYDITNFKIPCRIDVLYGYKTIRPQLACRMHADG